MIPPQLSQRPVLALHSMGKSGPAILSYFCLVVFSSDVEKELSSYSKSIYFWEEEKEYIHFLKLFTCSVK